MTAEDLKFELENRPFNPFTIHVSDGHPFDVPTPQYLSINPAGTKVFVWHAVGPGYTIVSMDSIVRVSPVDSPLETAESRR